MIYLIVHIVLVPVIYSLSLFVIYLFELRKSYYRSFILFVVRLFIRSVV